HARGDGQADSVRPSRCGAVTPGCAARRSDLRRPRRGAQDQMRRAVMNVIVIALVSLLITTLSGGPAAAWSHSGKYGSASGGGGSRSATNDYGGSASHTRGEGTTATTASGATATHE